MSVFRMRRLTIAEAAPAPARVGASVRRVDFVPVETHQKFGNLKVENHKVQRNGNMQIHFLRGLKLDKHFCARGDEQEQASFSQYAAPASLENTEAKHLGPNGGTPLNGFRFEANAGQPSPRQRYRSGAAEVQGNDDGRGPRWIHDAKGYNFSVMDYDPRAIVFIDRLNKETIVYRWKIKDDPVEPVVIGEGTSGRVAVYECTSENHGEYPAAFGLKVHYCNRLTEDYGEDDPFESDSKAIRIFSAAGVFGEVAGAAVLKEGGTSCIALELMKGDIKSLCQKQVHEPFYRARGRQAELEAAAADPKGFSIREAYILMYAMFEDVYNVFKNTQGKAIAAPEDEPGGPPVPHPGAFPAWQPRLAQVRC